MNAKMSRLQLEFDVLRFAAGKEIYVLCVVIVVDLRLN